MSFDAQFALDTVLPLAEAAYDLSKLPAEWKVLVALQPDDFGYIAESDDTAVLAFRGTKSLVEWFRDFDAIIVPNSYGKGFVHDGMQRQYSILRPGLVVAASTVDWNKYKRIIFIGHSLGGALAQQAAADLFNGFGKRAEGYTFESPRVGWFNWASWFNENIDVWWALEVEGDIVPHAPPTGLGWRRGGVQILLKGDFSTDVHENHALAMVRVGLQKLLKVK